MCGKAWIKEGKDIKITKKLGTQKKGHKQDEITGLLFLIQHKFWVGFFGDAIDVAT